MDRTRLEDVKTQKLSTYVEPKVKDEFSALAELHHRSLANELRLAVIEHLERARIDAEVKHEAY